MVHDQPFVYLLINHVPFGRTGRAGRFLTGDMWMQDVRAQRAALEAVGGRLIVACPLADELDVRNSGSFNLVEVAPREEGFEYVALPYYTSLRGWLSTRSTVRRALKDAIDRASVVHMGDGAHPIAMDQIAWPIAGQQHKMRVWVYDGADVLPRLQEHAESRRTALERMVWRKLVRRRERFSRRAIQEADLVFAHNAAVVKRFADVWDERCHVFDRSFVTEEALVSEAGLREREVRLLDASRPLKLVVAGRQIRMKGTDQVLQAMARAAQAGARLELDVYGDGDDLEEFKRLAATLGLDARVRFHGAIPYGRGLFERLSESHAMVLTNLTPEISRNVLLAMAMGLPLIAYRNPGTDELIDSNDAGTLVGSADVAALAQAFVAADRDRATLARHARHGRAIAAVKTLGACHRERAELTAACVERRSSRGSR